MDIRKTKKAFDKILPYISDTGIDIDSIQKVLNSYALDADELTKISYELIHEYNRLGDAEFINGKYVTSTPQCSNYLPELMELLIENGLDPNHFEDDGWNAMWEARWLEVNDDATKTLKVLLEHGGNPNIINTAEGESLYSSTNSDVGFDCFGLDNVMRFWLLLIAYGGCDEEGKTELIMKDGRSVNIFKNINDFDFRIEPRPDGYDWLHIIDKNSGQEVAMYEKYWNIS